jgi:hypothetical protein
MQKDATEGFSIHTDSWREKVMKKAAISLFVAAALLMLAASPASAGDKQRHRWEGVAIGVGAAILGHAILSDFRDRECRAPEPVHVYKRGRWHRHPGPPPTYSRGHWEIRKVWVPPVCEKVWNPGHYDRCGDWVPGRWITLEKSPGYWTKERVWVARR